MNLREYEAYCHSVLPKATFGFYGSGGTDMVTLRTNRAAFQRLRLRPRILRDVSVVDTSTTLLGRPVSCPIGLAPCCKPDRHLHAWLPLNSSLPSTTQLSSAHHH